MSSTVVQDFNHVERCKDSLYMGTPPRGFMDPKLKKICQRYADRPRYVTLYDPAKRIPVYSAYTFKKTEGDRRVDYPWMYEPQVCDLYSHYIHSVHTSLRKDLTAATILVPTKRKHLFNRDKPLEPMCEAVN